MKKILPILLSILLFTGCGVLPSEIPTEFPKETTLEPLPPETTQPASTPAFSPSQPRDVVERILGEMTIEDRVGQILLARCNAETALSDIETYHLGGFVLFGADFENDTPESFRKKADSYQAASPVPMILSVDEEGGDVTRISRYSAYRASKFPSLRKSWKAGGLAQILEIEEEKCALLISLGINVNLGPVCDISNDADAFMYNRSLGQSAETTAQVVSDILRGYHANGVGTVLKHFPGYGNNADTHVGLAVDSRSLEELEKRDLIPFSAGIDVGAGAILVSHNIVEALDGTLPASLSPAVHSYLRDTMGFEGVILTDDLYMQAITDEYGVEEAAVLAVLAGNDMLCVTEYAQQYNAILEAVYSGRIPYETLDNAARNVLNWKKSLGLLS